VSLHLEVQFRLPLKLRGGDPNAFGGGDLGGFFSFFFEACDVLQKRKTDLPNCLENTGVSQPTGPGGVLSRGAARAEAGRTACFTMIVEGPHPGRGAWHRKILDWGGNNVPSLGFAASSAFLAEQFASARLKSRRQPGAPPYVTLTASMNKLSKTRNGKTKIMTQGTDH